MGEIVFVGVKPTNILDQAITAQEAWAVVAGGFLTAGLYFMETGTWDGLICPVFMIIVLAACNKNEPAK